MSGKYTVNEVEERTKVPASTLRQWERRYGFPMPARSESGYRLYSDFDVQQIETMKRYIGDGVPASRAAALVKNAKSNPSQAKSTQHLGRDLLNAMIDLNDTEADKLLSEAYALHTVEKVLLEIMKPTMLELGNMWHDGKISTTTEHFASSYVQGKLRGLFSLAAANQFSPSIVVACAPGDQHELGALMLAVLLRRQGYRVYYIGANTPVADLVLMAKQMKPLSIMISASTTESVERLLEEKAALKNAAELMIYGGAGFERQQESIKDLGGHSLSTDLENAVKEFAELINGAKVEQ